MRVGPSGACLYQGEPPQLLLVNGVWHRGTVVRTDPPGPDPTKAMSKQKSKAAAKAQAAPSNLALPLSMIPLLAAYRNTVHGCKVRQSRHGTRVIQLGETAVEQLQRKIDRLASVPADLVSSATLEEARRTRTLMHGIHKLLVEIQCFDAVSFTGEFAAQLHDMKYFRRLAKRANATDLDNVAGTGLSMAALLGKLKQELGDELSCDPSAVPIDEPADALEFSRLDGLALTAVRSSASEIEPWLFLPTYVGTESVTVSQLYNARGGEDGRSRSGPSGKARDALEGSNGILLIGSPESLAARLTTAWTVTGNPYLHVPSQDLAVLCCSLWSLVESAFKICRLKDPDPVRVEGLLWAAVGLSERVSARMETWGWARDLVARLAALESDADFTAPFTESHGVLSVCMVLSALLRADAYPVLSSKAYSRIVLALLGEAVSRSCRVCLRASGRSAGDFIQGALKRFPRKGAAMAGVGDVDMEESTRCVASQFFLSFPFRRNRRFFPFLSPRAMISLGFVFRQDSRDSHRLPHTASAHCRFSATLMTTISNSTLTRVSIFFGSQVHWPVLPEPQAHQLHCVRCGGGPRVYRADSRGRCGRHHHRRLCPAHRLDEGLDPAARRRGGHGAGVSAGTLSPGDEVPHQPHSADPRDAD